MIELLPFFGLLFYLVPFMVAAARGHPGAAMIMALNIVLGWTVIGWVLLLIYAMSDNTSES